MLSVHPTALTGFVPLALIVWAGLLVATGAFALATLAPWSFWSDFFRREKATLLFAGLVAIAAQLATDYLQRALPSLGDLTLRFSETLLRIGYDDVVVDQAARTLGTTGFQVEVTDSCAGYEGMALVSLFLLIYLWLFRRDFRFPRVLLMFPLGILVIWCFNALRIAVLDRDRRWPVRRGRDHGLPLECRLDRLHPGLARTARADAQGAVLRGRRPQRRHG